MTRQSISLTKPNDEWLKEQLKQEEYTSKSELINDLIRKEREKEKEIEWLRLKLLEGEQSGFTNLSAEEILTQSKEQLRRNGKL
ncbi:ribbon-helix-helix domain-containing protein [Salinimicrobium sediminilitoris]|uniref:ribbon-helix-helix domain-containing protein n=1 Tax=Salinimicrobium sediminilitoris TaxID=2876715 RepID=UPI001E57A9E9|nr:type II toxin-antitoxin system ParD family antitoxin [Salinimicrobium sediminilitoris]MCC8358547.1 type II toxin-antitoxin system ParD family antitoxin [Salinimicrobium sediminilitoris]